MDLQLISKAREFSLTLSTKGRRTIPLCVYTHTHFPTHFPGRSVALCCPIRLVKLSVKMGDPAASGLLKFLGHLSASFSGCVTFHLFRYFHVAKKKKKGKYSCDVFGHILQLSYKIRVENNKKTQ